MNYEEIDNAICVIMTNDGPDRHVDGHVVITGFIMSLLDGSQDEWVKKYNAAKEFGPSLFEPCLIDRSSNDT